MTVPSEVVTFTTTMSEGTEHVHDNTPSSRADAKIFPDREQIITEDNNPCTGDCTTTIPLPIREICTTSSVCVVTPVTDW